VLTPTLSLQSTHYLPLSVPGNINAWLKVNNQLKVPIAGLWEVELLLTFLAVQFVGCIFVILYYTIFPEQRDAAFFCVLPLCIPVAVSLVFCLQQYFSLSQLLLRVPSQLLTAKLRMQSRLAWQQTGARRQEEEKAAEDVGEDEPSESVVQMLELAAEALQASTMAEGVQLFGFPVNAGMIKIVISTIITALLSQAPALLEAVRDL
jgi:hypothetical protein